MGVSFRGMRNPVPQQKFKQVQINKVVVILATASTIHPKTNV